ncbi:MAG: AAA family ATPase [Candidatus Lokiarchaeota archaeon]|nr:AAA family ATPase [Candidatus Lokiarchaeota archaeon]
MLHFQKIRYKNILSAGNQFIEIDLDSYRTTVVRGANGQGKSLIVTSLIFGLYGKSNRGTTKKQLVNSVNKKDCLVEIEFSSSGKEYKVRRGISPNIFEIYINGKLQDELSAVRDQQKYLEQTILKMSYKTFMQVVVLGSTNYTPFMQLTASDRRDLVEELLDIKIFSSMNLILRERIKNTERSLGKLEMEKVSALGLIEAQRHYIQTIKATGLDDISKKEKQIQDVETDIEVNKIEILNITKSIELLNKELENLSFAPKKLKQFLSVQGKLHNKKTSICDELGFFNQNSVCPTCKQEVDDEFKDVKIKELDSRHIELDNALSEIYEAIVEEEKRESNFISISKQITDLNYQVSSTQNENNLKSKQIKNIELEILGIKDKLENENVYVENLKSLTKKYKKIERDQSKCREVLEYFEFSYLLMKDGGIKSKIIENYLPVMNSQINKYLQMMDLYINFSLDNEFKESIKTPIHEDFSYGSFSEGEKQRINLSLLLAWRDIARMKNSANCNIMFFDETLDSSLDGTGIEDLLKIINYIIKDSNIFIISHRDGYDDKFERVIEVKKVNGFTKISS